MSEFKCLSICKSRITFPEVVDRSFVNRRAIRLQKMNLLQRERWWFQKHQRSQQSQEVRVCMGREHIKRLARSFESGRSSVHWDFCCKYVGWLDVFTQVWVCWRHRSTQRKFVLTKSIRESQVHNLLSSRWVFRVNDYPNQMRIVSNQHQHTHEL